MPILEIKIQLGREPDGLLRQLTALKIEGEALVRQACDGSKAGRLPFELKDSGQ